MTVYVIAQLRFTDVAAYRRYQAAFPPVFAKFDARVLAADESPRVLEGTWTGNKVVVMSFPDEAEAQRFVDDPDYAAISRDRHAGAETISLLVQGIRPRG